MGFCLSTFGASGWLVQSVTKQLSPSGWVVQSVPSNNLLDVIIPYTKTLPYHQG